MLKALREVLAACVCLQHQGERKESERVHGPKKKKINEIAGTERKGEDERMKHLIYSTF